VTLTVRFHPAAEAELDAAHDWYEQENLGVGAEFVAEVRPVIQNTAEWPALAPRVAVPGASSEVRRAGLRRFPYGVVYVVRDDVLWVMAVAHDRRRPGYWHGRQR
jgi:plasmid stabilization system protein ParE